MNKYLALLLVFFFLETEGQITFQKTYGDSYYDYGRSISQTFDGGYIIVGLLSNPASGDPDLFILKTDANGDTVWTKIIGNASDDFANCVEQTTDSGFIILGAIGLGGAGIYEDATLIKMNSNGDTLWTKTFNTGLDATMHSVHQTGDGGYILAGGFSGWFGSEDIYFIKTDSNSNVLWTKIIGSGGIEYATSVLETFTGGIVIAGSYPGSGMGHNIFLQNVVNGSFSHFGGSDDDFGNCCKQTADSGFIIVGSTRSFGTTPQNIYLVKANSNMQFQWAKVFSNADGLTPSSGIYCEQTLDGGYIILAEVNSAIGNRDLALIKTNAVGDTMWIRTYGGSNDEYGYCVKQTTDSGFAILGVTESFGSGFTDIYFVKTDSNGYSGCNEGFANFTMSSGGANIFDNPLQEVSLPESLLTVSAVIHAGTYVSDPCINAGTTESISNDPFLDISPNPFTQSLNLHFKRSHCEIAILRIFNSIGEIVYIKEIKLEDQILNLAELPKGIYMVSLLSEGRTYNLVIVK
ncbi:MAG: T9SS type A sorting domain-containing protein [Bacteroidota bacterium]